MSLDARQTAIGQIVGTPTFLAPEAAVSATGIDQRADLYALGCVRYWLLTGCLVFEGSTAMGMAIAPITRAPAPPSSRVAAPVAPQLEQLIVQCLAQDREQRPGTAHALRQALEAVRFAEPWSRERAALWWGEQLGRAEPCA